MDIVLFWILLWMSFCIVIKVLLVIQATQLMMVSVIHKEVVKQ